MQRLLDLVIDPSGLDELARQNKYARDLVSEDAREKAYPFPEPPDRDHNLVTLLAWSDILNARPTKPNRFFEAKSAGRLQEIEADRRRTISFSLLWPARIIHVRAILGRDNSNSHHSRNYPRAALFTYSDSGSGRLTLLFFAATTWLLVLVGAIN